MEETKTITDRAKEAVVKAMEKESNGSVVADLCGSYADLLKAELVAGSMGEMVNELTGLREELVKLA